MTHLKAIRFFLLALTWLFLARPLVAQPVDQAKEIEALRSEVARLRQQVDNLPFVVQQLRKANTDTQFQLAAAGNFHYSKVTYKSKVDGFDVPAYIFTPLAQAGIRRHPALLWIHGGVHGDLDSYFAQFMKPFLAKGYVIIAPEYRGSTGYGRRHYEAIDYGGKEVDDCLTAVDYLIENVDLVDPQRVGLIGWSHGGFIALHSIFREPEKFACSVDVVGVTDLITRLAYKSDGYRRIFSAQPGIGGTVEERREIYLERSPLYQVEKLRTPLLIHAADNDDDVHIIENERLIEALKKAGKQFEYKIYHNPPGGHSFNRVDSPQSRDSWKMITEFLERHLEGR